MTPHKRNISAIRIPYRNIRNTYIKLLAGIYMRIFIYLVFISVLYSGCNKGDDNSPSEISMDTIYSGDFIWREKKKDKRLAVLFDNGKHREKPMFKLNQENLLRIRVARLFEYEVFPSDIHGAEIIKVDTMMNLFLVTPTDSSFSFVVNQYYPKGRVVGFYKNWNDETKAFDERLTPLNGFKPVTHFEWTVK
jgi:hypothetical protein